METLIKPKRTQDELIKYLIKSKKESQKETLEHSKTEAFQEEMKILREMNKTKNEI